MQMATNNRAKGEKAWRSGNTKNWSERTSENKWINELRGLLSALKAIGGTVHPLMAERYPQWQIIASLLCFPSTEFILFSKLKPSQS